MSPSVLLTPHASLRSVYDLEAYPQELFEADLAAVHAQTAVERQWIDEAGLEPYASDAKILEAADRGELVRVGRGIGYVLRDYLAQWDPSRSDPSHEYHYSPPYLRPEALAIGRHISERWQDELGPSRHLVWTSLVRSVPYQTNLARQERKLTIMEPGKISSHQVGLAFDIDGCGIKEEDDNGNLRPMNPRMPGFMPELLKESRYVLKKILNEQAALERINVVEELPGTEQHVFHVCANPLQIAA